MQVHRCPECGNRLTTNYCDICMRKVPFAGAKPRKNRDPWDYSSAHREEDGHKCITFDAPVTTGRKQSFTGTKQTFTRTRQKAEQKGKAKKVTVVVVILAILSVITSVFEMVESAIEPEPDYSYEEVAPESADVPGVEARELYNSNGIRVTLDSAGLYYDDYALFFTIENQSEQDINVNTQLLSVNSYMLNSMLYEEVKEGESVQAYLPIYSYELEQANIHKIAEIGFVLDIFDAEKYATIATTELITVHTDAAKDYEVTVDDSGMELYNDGSLRIMAQSAELSGYGDGQVKLYMENRSGSIASVSTPKISLNGQEVSGGVWISLRPDTRAITEIYFYEFEQLDITQMDQIKEISLDLHIGYLEDGDVVQTVKETIAFDPGNLL